MSAAARSSPDGEATPLTQSQLEAVESLARSLDPHQLAWVSGYLNGLATRRTKPSAVPPPADPILIVHASQTGNATRVTKWLETALVARGCTAEIWDARRFKVARLKQATRVAIVASTYGEGEPPDAAQIFYRDLMGPRAPRLEQLRFTVLALGDRGYEHFCKTGQDIDRRLSELGATPLLERLDCDLDFEAPSREWIAKVAGEFSRSAAAVAHQVVPLPNLRPQAAADTTACVARVSTNQRLTGRSSSKDVRHIEFEIDDPCFRYQPGDSVSIAPWNDRALVEMLLVRLALDGSADVIVHGQPTSLHNALLRDLEISVLTRPLLASYAGLCGDSTLDAVLADSDRLRAYLVQRDLLDLVSDTPPPPLAPQQLTDMLRRLPRRSYSIASSQRANPGELHLTVGIVGSTLRGRERRGVASHFLAAMEDDAALEMHLEVNPNFRLPEDPLRNVIMIGAGTGVAPYRAFVQERETMGSHGAAWLIFGDRTLRDDFLYQSEWLDYRDRGQLERLDVAFSRHDAGRIYVQDRLRDVGADVWRWLDDGAHLYVCGGIAMGRDVHAAIIDVVADAHGADRERAIAYIDTMSETGRYQRDVY